MEATNNNDSGLARTVIHKLFELTGIQRVVCVDDTYADTTKVEEVIGLCAKLEANECTEIPELREVRFEAPEDIWKDDIHHIWHTLDKDARIRVHATLSEVANVENDFEDATILSDLLRKYDLQELSLSDWNTAKSDLLTEATETGTLFLFDQDFSKEEAPTNHGITLIHEVLAVELGQKSFCGLLSHTFTADEEYEEWQALSTEHGVEPDKFVLLSKKRLREDPLGFARMVKLTVLSSRLADFRSKVAEINKEAQAKATEEMAEVNIYDFDHIVFQSSRREGVWEPDTLFRIFGLFQRTRARELAKSNEALRQLAAVIRNVNEIQADLTVRPEPSSWRIRRLELYDDGDYLNSAHMPIELGDIFRKVSGGKEFILLSQPCDLMIRSDGKRNPAVTEALLATIVNQLPTDEDDNPTGHEAHYELHYYDQQTRESRFVSFRKSQAVRLWVLDLCVYQRDGSAAYKIGEPTPNSTVPTWELYHEKLTQFAGDAIEKYVQLQNALSGTEIEGEHRNRILKQTIPVSSNENLFKGEIDVSEKSLAYGFKRVGRLSQPYAAAMLTKYANYYSRAAFDHDFGQQM